MKRTEPQVVRWDRRLTDAPGWNLEGAPRFVRGMLTSVMEMIKHVGRNSVAGAYFKYLQDLVEEMRHHSVKLSHFGDRE